MIQIFGSITACTEASKQILLNSYEEAPGPQKEQYKLHTIEGGWSENVSAKLPE